ncbi:MULTISPECIES: A24 family peptidase [Bacillaceae]|uniref:Prepilin peptidase n=1 Tax=Evansella alkalicola TaxID=745819 RepID=A0ABS6JSB9_9BACI|nr:MULTISPECIES: prepilin peptidase [Bacillaceae]MBU9721315.1 prepilin peptidase [Bacillus alkalicola]
MTIVVLFIALAISIFTDIKDRKILNIVTFPAMIAGLTLNTITYGWDGFLFSLLGLLTGLALLIIPYALGGMAAGDVKLLMAIGALQGAAFTLGSFLYIAIIGGMIAFLILVKQKELICTIRRILFSAQFRSLDGLNKNELHHAFPYGVAIVLGTVCYSGVMFL